MSSSLFASEISFQAILRWYRAGIRSFENLALGTTQSWHTGLKLVLGGDSLLRVPVPVNYYWVP